MEYLPDAKRGERVSDSGLSDQKICLPSWSMLMKLPLGCHCVEDALDDVLYGYVYKYFVV